MPKTFAIIDGSSYFYRAFYAVPRLTNSKGFPTNAALGFTNMLLRVQRHLKPDYMAMIFDKAEITFRNELYKEYKANRQPMPDELSKQIPYIKKIPRAFNINTLELDNYEADDIIATLATKAHKKGCLSVIVSADKDLMQLVSKEAKDDSPGIVIYDDGKDKFIGIKETIEKFGVPPEKLRDLQALMGDSVDNIPGVKGVGEKTAAKLIQQFGDVDNLLKSIDQVAPERIKNLIVTSKDNLVLSRRLVTLEKDLEIEFKPDEFEVKEPNTELLSSLFTELEFSRLLKEFAQPKETTADATPPVTSPNLKKLSELGKKISIYTLADGDEPMTAQIHGIACHDGKNTFFIPTDEIKGSHIRELSNRKVVSYDVKSQLVSLRRFNLDPEIEMDTLLASYLLNPDGNHGFIKIAREFGNVEAPKKSSLFESDLFNKDQAVLFAAQCAKICLDISPKLSDELKKKGLEKLLYDVEIPLTRVLADMETTGVKIDTKYLEKLSKQFSDKLSQLQAESYKIAGEEFNLESPKQLQKIFFEKLGFRAKKKTQTGFSTDISVLEDLAKTHELPAKIIEHRTLAKLLHGYIDALPKLVNKETGRVHTSYNQAVAATGRISSSNPNLQNIPIRTREGRLIRKAFTAEDGNTLVWADYSQIELRLLAHFSQDPILVKAFNEDKDIHTQTAIEVFQVLPQMVTSDMRRKAKEINFSIIYGISPRGLYLRTGIPVKEAQLYIERYFERYSKVKSFMDTLTAEARKEGCVRTILNRLRYVPGIDSTNSTVKNQAERIAINAPIQGSAADLIKLAMIQIHKKLKKTSSATFRGGLIMQVHDELVVEAKESEAEHVAELLRDEMSSVFKLSVPLKVDTNISKSWEKE